MDEQVSGRGSTERANGHGILALGGGTMRDYRIEAPCDVRWEDLEPRPGGRYCTRCCTLVRDLSDATEEEARVWAGRTCARIRADVRGVAILRRSRMALSAAVLVTGLAGCDGRVSDSTESTESTSSSSRPNEQLPVGVFLPPSREQDNETPGRLPLPAERRAGESEVPPPPPSTPGSEPAEQEPSDGLINPFGD